MRSLLRRATPRRLLFAALAAAAAAQALAGLLLFRRLEAQLESDLGRRLVHVATLLALSVDAPLVRQFHEGDEDLPGYVLVRRRLAAQAEAAGVSRAYVLDADQRTLVDTEPGQPPGRVRHALLAHRRELEAARAGTATATRLYDDEQGRPRLSAFAPLRARDGTVAALVAVDAPPGFFTPLGVLRREMLLLGAVAVGLLLLAGALAAALGRELDRRERLAALGGMAGGLLHELGNPLAALTMYLDLLRPLVAAGEAGDLLDRAHREDTRLREFLEDFRVFAGLAPLRVGDLDLPSVVAAAAEPLTWPDGAAPAMDGHRSARGDGRLLVHAVRNLLRNALEAGATRVGVHIGGAGEHQITVSDDGPGLTPTELNRVREPFHTTKPHGSGLGLLIARRVAELHGGRLEAASHKGGGARFTLRWPAATEKGR
jgi:signal transduction histidine kinase